MLMFRGYRSLVRPVRIGVAVAAAACALGAANAQAALPGHSGYPMYTAPQAGSRALFALSRHPSSLVQVERTGATTALMRARGGSLVVPGLNVWRLPTGTAQSLVPVLQQRGVLRVIEPQRKLSFFATKSDPDPLVAQEWWLHAVGADSSVPSSVGVSKPSSKPCGTAPSPTGRR